MASGIYTRPIVTEVLPLHNYSAAEDYHQDFFARNPHQGYCLAVAAPKVANTPSAKKRAKQAEKRRSHNASLRSMVRTYIKNVIKAIDAKELEKAQTAYVLAVPVIDRMADKGIIHKNKAARHKSRLNGHIKALSEAAAA